MNVRILAMVATVIDACAEPRARQRGHPPAETIRVLATLRQFLRDGIPWRSLTATADQASGSTLRRHLENWARNCVLQKVHAVLVAMLRGAPDLILDTCSVRATRGGDLTGPNPTDRGKSGTKYHVAVRCAGGLRGDRRQCQRHPPVRRAVPAGLCGPGPDPDRVRRQGL